MAQARTSLSSTITYSRSNSAGLAQSGHGAKTPVNNKGAFITDASVLEKQFGMNMGWLAPQMSIRKRATEPFIFSHQHPSTSSSTHDSIASSSVSLVDVVKEQHAADAFHESTKAVLECGRSQRPVQARVAGNEKAPDDFLHESQCGIHSVQHRPAQCVGPLSAGESAGMWYTPRRLFRLMQTSCFAFRTFSRLLSYQVFLSITFQLGLIVRPIRRGGSQRSFSEAEVQAAE
ncbi:uncharacterized protein LAESUDRAFT_764373 [Laetiporus sulphureus 93-53]|uniref:Uncharacterized protein n=1 Tax=Laetiporus sulphureus 93-53 TaxID=1314785 RepID=A0A165BBU3_9APHY|nr:uncharacterized protein LAESUDRAFT_764373 [Laetiporus sulphureus 93-53]KZT00694.1 hypothetical protein LAESUDRAFT_764373 [Laetiporus sulphureus 93-53]